MSQRDDWLEPKQVWPNGLVEAGPKNFGAYWARRRWWWHLVPKNLQSSKWRHSLGCCAELDDSWAGAPLAEDIKMYRSNLGALMAENEALRIEIKRLKAGKEPKKPRKRSISRLLTGFQKVLWWKISWPRQIVYPIFSLFISFSLICFYTVAETKVKKEFSKVCRRVCAHEKSDKPTDYTYETDIFGKFFSCRCVRMVSQ